MANTYADYTGDGSETDFAINFDYIKTSHVAVEVNEGPAGGTNTWVRKTLGSDYTVVTSPTKQVVFTSAPANLVRVRVLRDSDANVGIVDFANGSVLTETELDNAYNHNRYLAQEAEEGASGGGFTKNPSGQYDADGLRIENLAAPDSDDDAVNKGYADTRFVNVTGDTLTGALTLSGDPTSDLHAATKQYVDDEVTTAVATEASARISGDNDQVSKTGDTMSGNLAMGGNKVTGLGTPGTGTDAANKTYVDDTVASVTAGTIPDGTITTSKIADGAVTAAKLDSGVGGENNVQSDWNEADTNSDAFILNKPTIPTNVSDLSNDAGYTANAGTVIEVSTGTGLTGGPITGTGTISIDTGGVDTTQLADDSVTSTKISSTDTNFNINDSTGNIGIGVTADSSDKVLVNGALTLRGTGNKILRVDSTNGLGYLYARSGSQAANQKEIAIYPFNGKLGLSWITDAGGAGFIVQLDQATGSWQPNSDNIQNLGASSNRWATVFAGTGTINTSDRNEKENIEELSDAERRVATAIKGLVKKFRFVGRVRTHVGVIAQDVKDAFTAEGLNAADYGMFCSDTFQDEDGATVTRLGIRYEELLAFVISAL